VIKQGMIKTFNVKLLLNLDNIHNIRYLEELMYYFCDYFFYKISN